MYNNDKIESFKTFNQEEEFRKIFHLLIEIIYQNFKEKNFSEIISLIRDLNLIDYGTR
jgi:hypothetical protein